MADLPSSSSSRLRPRPPKREKPLEIEEDKPKSKGKGKAKDKGKGKAEEPAQKRVKRTTVDPNCKLDGEPIPDEEARSRWPDRYNLQSQGKKSGDDEDEGLVAKCHFSRAKIDGEIYELFDHVHVESAVSEGKPYVGRIIEFFRTVDNREFFATQWYYRAEDTFLGQIHAHFIGEKRVFLSDDRNDNPLDCIVEKIKVVKVSPNVDLYAKEKTIPSDCHYFYDMKYHLSYHTFSNLPGENIRKSSMNCKDTQSELKLLDLYAGCGGMSTGLCLGAASAGVKLTTRWAVDFNEEACQSLRFNHPETEVRHGKAEDYLALLKEWRKLCIKYGLVGTARHQKSKGSSSPKQASASKPAPDELEVEKIVDICFGDPKENKNIGLYFKVRWKGYPPSEDTWEPSKGLGNCKDCIKEFVIAKYHSHAFPLPGDVDVICGGPPCQGISGFNRFRNPQAPLEDPKNAQLIVYMDFVDYLKPKFVLMENVVDLLKFAGGYLGRYAAARLLALDYQARLGMMVAGCYGLPQFRMRAFLLGALPTETLPQFPLPTNEVVVRGTIPVEFEGNVVAYEEFKKPALASALLLADAISDLPAVSNYEERDEMPYDSPPLTDFQKFIRLSREEMLLGEKEPQKKSKPVLFDHRPLKLNKDDNERVSHIPKKKGACFRDLAGVIVKPDNKVEFDPTMERVRLTSGKFLVPDYAMSFCKGASSKPFGRLWWNETVPTVVTRAEPHNQAILHPEQDRVLTVRENARLQGFPDHYRLFGSIKERYTQVGNAVAVPVGRALGYALASALLGRANGEPVFSLPPSFSIGDVASTSGSQ